MKGTTYLVITLLIVSVLYGVLCWVCHKHESEYDDTENGVDDK